MTIWALVVYALAVARLTGLVTADEITPTPFEVEQRLATQRAFTDYMAGDTRPTRINVDPGAMGGGYWVDGCRCTIPPGGTLQRNKLPSARGGELTSFTRTDRIHDVCPNCLDTGHACENHLDKPWDGWDLDDDEQACHCGGAGMPCPTCCGPIPQDGTHRISEAFTPCHLRKDQR